MRSIPIPTAYTDWRQWASNIYLLLQELFKILGVTTGLPSISIYAYSWIGEVKLVAFPALPVQSLICDGTVYNISDYPLLFNVISNTFGGDGVTTFAVPNIASPVTDTVYIIATVGRPPA